MEDASKVAGVREGDILASKYRVEKVLGIGGMGVVVAAHHLQLDERVAIKFLLPQALGSPEAVARFAREGRAAVKIKNEHIARVIDVGSLPNGAPYMVMEFLEGADLAATLRQRGPLPIEEVVEHVLQACEALAEAHGLGIIHRDLKPGNVFVTRRPDGSPAVKVLDFGISKITGASGHDMGMTKTSALMGSPLYMSPEQMESSRNVDARTDLWAIGVILYELLTGKAPFDGQSLPEVCVKIANHPPPPIERHRPDVPAGLATVIVRCLEKDRAKRYANVGELAVALAPFGPKRARISAERIARVIHAAGLSPGMLPVAPAPDSEAEPLGGLGDDAKVTAPSWGRTTLGTPAAKKTIGSVVALLVAGAAAFILGRRSLQSAAEQPPVPAALAPASAPVTQSIVVPPPVPGPAPSESASAAGAATADSAALATSAPKVQPKLERPRPTAGATPGVAAILPTKPVTSASARPVPPPPRAAQPAEPVNVYDDRR